MNVPPLHLPISESLFADRLLTWYHSRKRDLPWRHDPEPYRVWVSEVMLQQTTVKAVLPYFESFLEKFPSVEDLAAADLNQVLSSWAGLGYYSRARNLHAAARRIVEFHKSQFPDRYSDVLALPGIGRYTAGAIVSICFGDPYPVVDGNVRRVVTRYLGVRRLIDTSLNNEMWSFLSDLASSNAIRDSVSDFKQALMELGALVCTPRKPDCSSCPLRESCVASGAGVQEEIPVTKPRRKTVELSFVSAVIPKDGSFLMRLNRDDPFLTDFWEFPRVPGTPDSHYSLLFRENHGLDLSRVKRLAPLKHQITFRKICFYPFLGSIEGEFDRDVWHWVRPGASGFPIPSYVRKIERSLLHAG